MATPFSSANRTKSFFSQVDQNRPQAAQQKLGGIMGSQSVLQNSTNAQQGENQKVGEATQAVAKNTTQGYGNLSEIGKAQGHVAAQREFAGQATPVLTTQIKAPALNTATVADKDLQGVVDNNKTQVTNSTNRAIDANKSVTDNYVNAGNALTDRGNAANGTGLAEKQLGETYQTDSDKLRDAQKQMTQGNLGQLAAPSNYELEQQQLAQVLADRQSNVGKLKALYGSGYDSSKFGALDSNLLQGQFNDAQGKAKEGLAGLENAKKGSDRAREQYLNQIDISQGITDKAKTDAEAKIADIGNQINILNDKINNSTASAGRELTKQKTALETKAEELRQGYGTTYGKYTKEQQDKIHALEDEEQRAKDDRARTKAREQKQRLIQGLATGGLSEGGRLVGTGLQKLADTDTNPVVQIGEGIGDAANNAGSKIKKAFGW